MHDTHKESAPAMRTSGYSASYSTGLNEKLLAWMRGVLPGPLRAAVREGRALIWRALHPRPSEVAIEDELPWCSSNVWERTIAGYAHRTAPVICEYGIGASTLHHVRNLLPLRGTYVGIEHDPAWYAKVLNSLLRLGLQQGMNARLESEVETASSVPVFRDSQLTLCGSGGSRVAVKLKLRGYPACGDPHGASLEEMPEYVRALSEPCDVVVVDGVVRKGCLDHVLGTTHLAKGGLLVLHDAGHGLENWLGRPTLTGTRDFRPEVQRMLAEGGEMAHGTGFDTWPGQKWRRTIGHVAFSYPFEACFMIRR